MTEKPPAAPAPANKTTELDTLREENARLRTQLAAAGGRVQQPRHTFQLSEGDRQELEIRGVVNINGRMMTKAEVQAAMSKAGAGQEDVEIADAPEGTRVDTTLLEGFTGPGVRGIDFVYPSVERGYIDPKIAGTPGISGPSADNKV
jgi:hypothetical protein